MTVVRTNEEKQAADQRKQVQRLRELNDLRTVMSTEEGRRVVWRLLEESRFFKSTYAPEAPESYYRQGRRSVGLTLYNNLLEACRDLYWQMQAENEKSEESNG